MRASSTGRGRLTPSSATRPGHGWLAGGLLAPPLAMARSSARRTRRGLRRSVRAAAVGSTVASRAANTGSPSASSSAASSRRTSAEPGCDARSWPSTRALTYRPVPPTTSGSRPRAQISGTSRSCLGDPVGHRECGVRIGQVQQVMRHRGARGRIGLGGADVHAAVHLARIGDQDLDWQTLRQGQAQIGLAGGGGADDGGQRRRDRLAARGRRRHRSLAC